MKEQLEKIPYVQVAMTTKGTYDLVLFLITKSTNDARSTLYDLTTGVFISFEVEWNITQAYQTFGFIPLRNEFFDILKEKVWTRTREHPKPLSNEITEVEFDVLKTMNNSADMDFSSIDQKINVDKGRSNYAYHQLTKKGIVKRATISLQNHGARYDAIFILKITNAGKFTNMREELLKDIILEQKTIFDPYSFTCDINSPSGIMLVAPMTNESDIGSREANLIKIMDGNNLDLLISTNKAVGNLIYRLFDKKEASQYNILISEYRYTAQEIKNIITD
jgi:predicted transcriptional regulator